MPNWLIPLMLHSICTLAAVATERPDAQIMPLCCVLGSSIYEKKRVRSGVSALALFFPHFCATNIWLHLAKVRVVHHC